MFMMKVLYISFNSKWSGKKTVSSPTREDLIFKSKSDFEKFVKHLTLLSQIRIHKVKSIYGLAQKLDMDVANVSKMISFYARLGVIMMEEGAVRGRRVNTPTVVHDEIRFEVEPNILLEPRKAIVGIVRRRR